jgi:hypothetical protein
MRVGFSGGLNAVFQNADTPDFATQAGGTKVQNAYQGNVSNCNPNSSWSQLGTRTMWNPVPDFDVGFDLSWVRLNTAFAGTANLNAFGTPFQQNATGRPPGLYSIGPEYVQRCFPHPAQLPVLNLALKRIADPRPKCRGAFYPGVPVGGSSALPAGGGNSPARRAKSRVRPLPLTRQQFRVAGRGPRPPGVWPRAIVV